MIEIVEESTSSGVDLFSFFDIDFGEILTDMIRSFGATLINELLVILNYCLDGILGGMLRIETLIDNSIVTVLTTSEISDIYQFIYLIAIALIALKLFFKGWQIYILWRDGDADNSPVDMLIGSAQAAVVIVAFPTLYEYAADITQFVAEGIIGSIGPLEIGSSTGLAGAVDLVTMGVNGVLDMILLLVYIVLLLVLWIILLKRGFELLILRLGVPLACLGLIDSDMGLFKNYMLILYKTLITSVIQICIMSLSIRLSMSFSIFNILLGIAAALTAFGAPVIMQSLLIPSGGGVTSKIHTASMAVNGVRRLFGK